jgi:hypothetical protein
MGMDYNRNTGFVERRRDPPAEIRLAEIRPAEIRIVSPDSSAR